jgi:rhamnogalacturonan endolyase
MKLYAKLTVIGALLLAISMHAQSHMEKLDRGVVAVRTSSSQVYVGWRMLGTEAYSVGYNVYRAGTKLNSSPITTSTNYVDSTTTNSTYTVRAVVNGVEGGDSPAVSVWAQNYLQIPLSIPAGGTTPDGVAYTYSANDCSVGDLDGDGQYEIVLKWDPSNSKDNSQSGYTGNVFLDAYKLNGTRLWRIDLGRNIRAGAHYTQLMVYDLDGDGKAEVVCKTAPGTKAGPGSYLSLGPAASDNDSADYRNSSGYILTGPEYLTVFRGSDGAELATTNYNPPRGTVSDWGDSYGNRVDRFLACIAYLDGSRPSVVMCRGYYTRCVLAAYDWRNGTLTQRWVFDSNSSGNSGYAGQGNHNLSVGDVDGDGKDEIVYGACCIDDNGGRKYTTGRGHGDAMHLAKMDPNRSGLQVWDVHETPNSSYGGGEYRDANTGALIWGVGSTSDCGRGVAGNITTVKGYQMWSARTGCLYNNAKVNIGATPSSMNFLCWWHGNLIRSLLDGTTISDYPSGTVLTASGCSSNNGTKSTPCLSADLLGDWREEVIWRTSDNHYLRIYTTTEVTSNRIFTLMHDRQYRCAIAWQNVAYNQPPHPSFYLGYQMTLPVPQPNIVTP